MRSGWWMAIAAALPLATQAAGTAERDFTRVMSSKPDTQRGAELFQKCTSCHGADGGGSTSGSIPRIAGQHYRVLVRQIVDFRNGTRWDVRMEGVATSHETIPELQDIADVASYVSRLDRGGARGVSDGEYVQRGAQLYAAKCASCHGPEAQGDDQKGIPLLAGQHFGYLARQIYDAVDNRRPPLARSHGKRFAPFDFQDVLGLTDYLARIGWKNEAAPADSGASNH